MASEIDDKKFELITRTENFDFAYDIVENFQSIKERLVHEFWDLLLKRFRNENPDCKIDDSLEQQVDIKYKAFNDVTYYFSIIDDHFEYGIYFANNGSKKKIQELESFFKESFNEDMNDEEQKLSFFYDIEDEDLDSLYGLKKLLPANRDQLIEKYIKDYQKKYKAIFKLLSNYYNRRKKIKSL
jgi:hypothetical protein